jgi:uncharacterized membrane protein (UPF0182 family)
VIPVESSLLYVMPVYLVAESTQIPEIKQVIVALGDSISMQPTLDQALSDVIGAQVTPTTTMGAAPTAPAKPGARPAPGGAAPSAEVTRLVNQASQQYDKAQQAQRSGDWAEYGKQISALKATLDELRSKAK